MYKNSIKHKMAGEGGGSIYWRIVEIVAKKLKLKSQDQKNHNFCERFFE